MKNFDIFCHNVVIPLETIAHEVSRFLSSDLKWSGFLSEALRA